MPEVKIELVCYTCNTELNSSISIRRENLIEVKPCEKCLERIRQSGFKEGYEVGKRDGFRNGINSKE